MSEATELSRSATSRTFSAPPRGETLVALERAHQPGGHPGWLELVRALPRPFQRVIEVRPDLPTVEVLIERFVGVDGAELVDALATAGRVLPLDVWLALGLRWGEALQHVPAGSEGWITPTHLRQLGVGVRGALVLTFEAPNHVLGRWGRSVAPPPVDLSPLIHLPESMSPEHVRAAPLTESSRVYSLAVTLLALLEGRQVFERHEAMGELLAAISLRGLSWRAPRNRACGPALEAVLRRATALDPAARYPTLPDFLGALGAEAEVQPASEARLFDVLLGVSPRMQTCLPRLEPSALPPSWRNGGLQVMQDELLERLVPLSALPRG